jgi:hypothetical protein
MHVLLLLLVVVVVVVRPWLLLLLAASNWREGPLYLVASSLDYYYDCRWWWWWWWVEAAPQEEVAKVEAQLVAHLGPLGQPQLASVVKGHLVGIEAAVLQPLLHQPVLQVEQRLEHVPLCHPIRGWEKRRKKRKKKGNLKQGRAAFGGRKKTE